MSDSGPEVGLMLQYTMQHVRYSLTGVPEWTDATGVKFTPQNLTVSFRNNALWSVRISGRRILKSGELSGVSTRDHDFAREAGKLTVAPAWVQAAVASAARRLRIDAETHGEAV